MLAPLMRSPSQKGGLGSCKRLDILKSVEAESFWMSLNADEKSGAWFEVLRNLYAGIISCEERLSILVTLETVMCYFGYMTFCLVKSTTELRQSLDHEQRVDEK